MDAHALATAGGVGGVGGERLQVLLDQLVHGLAVRLVRGRVRGRARGRARVRARGRARFRVSYREPPVDQVRVRVRAS